MLIEVMYLLFLMNLVSQILGQYPCFMSLFRRYLFTLSTIEIGYKYWREQFISQILNTIQVALLLVTLSHFQIISCVSKRKHHGRRAKMWHVADSEESCGQYYSIHDSSVRKPSTLCNLPQVLLVINHIFSIFILDQEHQQILCVSYHRQSCFSDYKVEL